MHASMRGEKYLCMYVGMYALCVVDVNVHVNILGNVYADVHVSLGLAWHGTQVCTFESLFPLV